VGELPFPLVEPAQAGFAVGRREFHSLPAYGMVPGDADETGVLGQRIKGPTLRLQ